jgi:anti-sigma factor RsiW
MALNEDEKADLVAYLDGELDEAATQAVEAKIATDADARAELDALKQTWGMLDYLPKASPSPTFTNRTMERLTLEKVGGPAHKTMVGHGRRFPWLVTACWAAALVLAISVGYFGATQFWSVTTTPEPIPDADRDLLRHLRVAEKWHLYENADDLEFVKKLNHPDLFGEDPS